MRKHGREGIHSVSVFHILLICMENDSIHFNEQELILQELIS